MSTAAQPTPDPAPVRQRCRSPRIRRPCVAALATALLAVAAVTAWVHWHTRPVTRFGPGFNERAFHDLKPRTTLPDVIAQVGRPLAFRVQQPHPETEAVWRHFEFKDTPHLLWECEGSTQAVLVYSWHARPDRPWQVYAVHLSESKVKGTTVTPAGGD